MFCTEHLLYLECLESNVRCTLRPCPRRTEVVVFVPERGGNKERWLFPDFEVLRTIASIAILSVLSGSSGLKTKSPGCDGEISSRGPLWLLGQPYIDPGYITYTKGWCNSSRAWGMSLTKSGVEFIELNRCVETTHQSPPHVVGDRRQDVGVEEVADQDKF